jgi:hypothetical protein
MAFINQINSQAFILSDPNGTTAPTIKQGAYISHGGSLYIVDTADATISGTPSDGTVYVRVSGTDTLTAEYVTDISSYAWNSAHNAMISGSYTLLPYMLIKSGTSWTKYRFEQHKQAFGDTRLNSLAVVGAISGASINTGHGANELYPMNQAVRTTDSPTFAKLTLTTSVEGSKSIAGGSSWVIPAGIYVVENTVYVVYEFYLSGSWFPVSNEHAKKTIFSDGTNFRLRNTDSSSKTVRYRKFS